MSDLQSAVSEAESILDGGRSVRRIWAPDYFFGVFTCFGFRFSRPRLSLLTPAVVPRVAEICTGSAVRIGQYPKGYGEVLPSFLIPL